MCIGIPLPSYQREEVDVKGIGSDGRVDGYLKGSWDQLVGEGRRDAEYPVQNVWG